MKTLQSCNKRVEDLSSNWGCYVRLHQLISISLIIKQKIKQKLYKCNITNITIFVKSTLMHSSPGFVYHRKIFSKKNSIKVCYSTPLKETSKFSLQKYANNINEKYDLPKSCHLNQMTFSNYAQIHISSLKKGPKPSLPWGFLELLQCHVSTCPFSSDRECKHNSLKSVIGIALTNTALKDRLSIEFVYKQCPSSLWLWSNPR